MIAWISGGGFFMWLVLGSGAVSLGLAVSVAWRLRSHGGQASGRRIDAVLFWGVLAAMLGVLGTVGGVAQMARVMAEAGGQASASLVWGGLGLTLRPTAAGLVLLGLSLVAWFSLRVFGEPAPTSEPG